MTPVQADMPPIVTLTLNPCVDVSYDIPQLIEDQKVHATATRLDPGGNGINVARALKRLRIPAWACATVAGEIGMLFERLTSGQIDHPHLVRIDGETRINTTLQQRQPRAQFEVSATGPVIDAATLDRISAEVLELARNGYAVLTGSRSPGVPPGYYADLCAALRAQGAKPVVDAQGEALAQAVAARPFLIKPNRFELEQLVGRPLPTRDEVIREARVLHAQGVEWVCVSLGGEGAVLVGAETYIGLAPEVAVVSTVGAGDSMVGGLVAALSRHATPADALRLALACGSGTSQQPGTELFDPAALPGLQAQVNIQLIA